MRSERVKVSSASRSVSSECGSLQLCVHITFSQSLSTISFRYSISRSFFSPPFLLPCSPAPLLSPTFFFCLFVFEKVPLRQPHLDRQASNSSISLPLPSAGSTSNNVAGFCPKGESNPRASGMLGNLSTPELHPQISLLFPLSPAPTLGF